MSSRKPWQPRIDSPHELNPFANTTGGHDLLLNTPQIQDAEEDSAPLQGTHDLSDADSLDDVISDSHEPKP
jgi:hypothetical protein